MRPTCSPWLSTPPRSPAARPDLAAQLADVPELLDRAYLATRWTASNATDAYLLAEATADRVADARADAADLARAAAMREHWQSYWNIGVSQPDTP